MTSRRRLEGGRGLYSGDEAFIDQGESFQGRRPPAQGGQFISTVPPYSATAGSTYTANQVNIYALPVMATDTIIEVARLRVTTLSAANNARVAVFTFDLRERTLKKIPGTEVVFATDATGLLETALLRSVRLVSGRPYFVGFKASDATAAFSSTVATTAGTLAALTVASAAGELPAAVQLVALASAPVLVTPSVTYISGSWKDVL